LRSCDQRLIVSVAPPLELAGKLITRLNSFGTQKDLARAWICGAGAIGVLLVMATTVSTLQVAPQPIAHFLSKLNLAGKNQPAAWWSGSLLFMSSIHAFDGYADRRLRDPQTTKGWLLIAVVTLALAFDELASLHERVAMWSADLGFNPWAGYFPSRSCWAGSWHGP